LGRSDEIFDFSKKIFPAGPLFNTRFNFEKGTLTNFFGRRYHLFWPSLSPVAKKI